MRKVSLESVLVVGAGKLGNSVAVCLALAGHEVVYLTDDLSTAQETCQNHFSDLNRYGKGRNIPRAITYTRALPENQAFQLAIVVTAEDLPEKIRLIQRLEEYLPETTTIAVNSETFDLALLQADAKNPHRILVANWVEPAHTTLFLELIGNEHTEPTRIQSLKRLASDYWNKDPYCLSQGEGIRQRLIAALIREALFLVQNDYASVEDIDRACRNDPGYYLPFAGNCRYMDLMGTYAYGMVMKDLNPELSKDRTVAPIYLKILEKGGQGMENREGFFAYQPEEVAAWEQKIRRFSYEIQGLIEKYPFAQPKNDAEVMIATPILSKT